jgi:hypothetical protein
VILPSRLATAPPPASGGGFTYSHTLSTPGARSQLIYDVNDIAPFTASWSALQLRRNAMILDAVPALTANVVVVMAMSGSPPLSPSTTFASNLQTLSTTVFTGTLSLSAGAAYPAWPAPWEAPLLFTVPFFYFKPLGQSLVVDLTVTSATASGSWLVEQWSPQAGFVTGAIAASCPFSNGAIYTGICNTRSPMVGAPWKTGYTAHPKSFPADIAGFAVIGTQGPGGLWAGLTLPVGMAAYGAPGCIWGVSADFVFPLSVAATCAETAVISIPNDPRLANATFYDQGFFLDTAANGLGAISTGGSKWTIGSGQGGPGSLVNAFGPSASTSTTGSVHSQLVTTVHLY